MKRLALISLVLLLNGCALINAYRMARFDNIEYALVNQIHTQAQLGVVSCGTNDVYSQVDNIYFKTVELRNYSASIPRNEETVTMTNELVGITKGLKDRYASGDPVSQKYCELKFNNIENSSGTMKTIIGAKPR
jgi:hypothetical protein